MEVKVTLEAGQSLIDLVNTLLQGLSRQTITSVPTEKKTKKQPKPEPTAQPEPTTEPILETTEAPAEELQINGTARPVIDYTKLRAEIRSLAAQKRAGSKDPSTLIIKYGGEKLSGVKDIDLPDLKRDLEAL